MAEEVEVIKPEVLARWRRIGVPEETIERLLAHRMWIREQRKVEEWVSVPGFTYRMPKLPDMIREPHAFAIAIDADGSINPHAIVSRRDKLYRIDRWRYRYEYYGARVDFYSETYEFTEKIARWMVATIFPVLRGRTLMYDTYITHSRAVRACYLGKPYFIVKKKEVDEVLRLYKKRPTIPVT